MVYRFQAGLLILACLACAARAEEPAPGAAGIRSCQIGFQGRFKLGCWTPVRVTITGAQQIESPRLEVIAQDGQGTPAVFAKEFTRPAEGPIVIDALTRVGRRNAPIRVRLLDREEVVDQWVSPSTVGSPGAAPSTDFLALRIGAESGAKLLDRAAQLSPDHMPSDWCAYEGANVVILRADGLPDPAGWATDQRIDALREWVEAGGKLVISGGENAASLIGRGAPLADLSPGEFIETARLTGGGVLEDYAESDESIEVALTAGLPVARIQVTRGVVELSAGRQASDMPLVVRRTVGFGQVTFLAFDLEAEQLREWKDYPRLVDRVLGLARRDRLSAAPGTGPLVTSAYSDLSGAITSKLGESFQGVRGVSMLTFVALVLAYLVLLGPAAYLLGQRSGAMHSVWITYPAIALLVGGSAAWYASRSAGDGPQVNQVEVIDVDCETGAQRGTLWAQAFSPRAARYDLACETVGTEGQAGSAQRGYLSWQGLPGSGMGGMLTSANTLTADAHHYQISPQMEGLLGAPINSRATMALVARWGAAGQPAVQFQLEPTDAGLVEGVVLNDTRLRLTDCKLAVGDWAWRLPDLPPGGSASIDRSRSAAKLHTLLLRDYGVQISRDNAAWGSVEDLEVDALAYLMMFHGKLGGAGFAQLGNRYQEYVDLSHAIHAGRPVLVARVAQPRAHITSSGAPLPTASRGVFYRFVGRAIPSLSTQDLP